MRWTTRRHTRENFTIRPVRPHIEHLNKVCTYRWKLERNFEEKNKSGKTNEIRKKGTGGKRNIR